MLCLLSTSLLDSDKHLGHNGEQMQTKLLFLGVHQLMKWLVLEIGTDETNTARSDWSHPKHYKGRDKDQMIALTRESEKFSISKSLLNLSKESEVEI